MRFGLHSGPVTAGVLRGEKSRFQLFGDTVNTGKDWVFETHQQALFLLAHTHWPLTDDLFDGRRILP